jgi:hypothetical protein
VAGELVLDGGRIRLDGWPDPAGWLAGWIADGGRLDAGSIRLDAGPP